MKIDNFPVFSSAARAKTPRKNNAPPAENPAGGAFTKKRHSAFGFLKKYSLRFPQSAARTTPYAAIA